VSTPNPCPLCQRRMCDHTPDERRQTLEEIFCDHASRGTRLVVREGRSRNDTFCLSCGVNVTLMEQTGRATTWSDLDGATRAFKKEEDRQQRSFAVAQAEQRANMKYTTPRRFECTAGGSSKFWTIWRVSRSHYVTFGKIGTDGQERSKGYRTVNLANLGISKLMLSKLKKGYVEVTQRVPNGPDVYGDPAEKDRGAAARKAWATRRKNEAAAKLAEEKKNKNHGLPPGFLGPRRVPKVK